MTSSELQRFVLDYTKAEDLINCVNYALQENFVEPEDYSNYGCKIDFITADNSNIKDEGALKEWYVLNNNKFVKKKITTEDSSEFSFPPPYNFVTEEDLTVNMLDDQNAEVEVATDNGTYVFKISKGGDNEYDLIINAIYLKMRWSDDLIPIIE